MMGVPTQSTGLQQATNPITGKGEHTRAPNILPSALNNMGKPASISGDKASSPGTRKV